MKVWCGKEVLLDAVECAAAAAAIPARSDAGDRAGIAGSCLRHAAHTHEEETARRPGLVGTRVVRIFCSEI